MEHDHLATILDSIGEGVFTVDADWRLTSFNRAAEIITGTTRACALGRPCSEIFRADICDGRCALRETLRTGEPILSRPIFITCADGERVPISISTAILRDSDGQVLGGVETFRDLRQIERLRRELEGRAKFQDIISKNARMQELFAVLPQIAASASTVLVTGESGTGKELFARAIHDLSPRHKGPFVAVNCAALSDNLLESELFGHVAGAFTGAVRSRRGRFEAADGGTLFLDEIGDVTPALQVRLLRVLQERTFEPLGSDRSRHVDVRVVAATNRDLEAAVSAGSFREDLYYRINVVRLDLPPLRERRDDIPLLVSHVLGCLTARRGLEPPAVSPEALARLTAHRYGGNVRELENVLEYAVVMSGGRTIDVGHLPPFLRRRRHDDDGEPVSLIDAERWVIRRALDRQHCSVA